LNKNFPQKFKSKALIHSQSDAFRFKGIACKNFQYIERCPQQSLKISSRFPKEMLVGQIKI
jgi:hypothetical protein